MNSLVILKEQRFTNNSGARDVADHLYHRMHYGKTVVVADRPEVFVGVLRKQWLMLARRTQVERARTLDHAKIAELDAAVRYMLWLRFTRRYPPGEYPGDVYVVGVKEALGWPPECSTMYIVAETELHEKYLLTSFMRPHSLVVMYERPN